MSIANTIAKMQALHLTVTGVASAPVEAYRPASITAELLPCVMVEVGECAWSLHSMGQTRQDRTYVVTCYVLPWGQGEGIHEAETLCTTLLQAFGAAYLADLQTSPVLDSAVKTILSIADSGIMPRLSENIGPLDYAGVPYWGFQFRVTVVEK